MTLREELAKDAYTGMTPEQMLVAVNTPTVLTGARQLVPLWKIKKLCVETGVWVAMKLAAVQTQSSQLAAVATLATEYINDTRFENLDLDLVSTKQMVGALVQGGVMTQAQADEIDDMANARICPSVNAIGRQATDVDISEAINY